MLHHLGVASTPFSFGDDDDLVGHVRHRADATEPPVLADTLPHLTRITRRTGLVRR